MRGAPRGWGTRWPALAAAGVLVAACAGPVRREADRWRASDGGASVADLAALEPGWRRVADGDALLTFAHPSGGHAAWLHQCRGAAAGARPEAHALLVRLHDPQLEREGPVSLAGGEGWSLVASASDDGGRVAVKTVTRVSRSGCTDDFVLVAPGEVATLEPGFDRWWGSFAEAAPP